MITLVLGGSGSGKSAYAEHLLDGKTNKYYIATMQVYDAEGEKKVARHRRLRAGKGFVTMEQPRDIGEVDFSKRAQQAMELPDRAGQNVTERPRCALLECMSNLVANEMFSGADIVSEDVVVGHILQGIKSLSAKVDELVIVSNNVFEDGISYDATTQAYIRALGRINTGVAELADTVTEVVVGIPVPVKERKQVMHIIRGIAVAFSTYSKIPMPQFVWKEEDMRYSMCFFPWIGAVIGAILWGWFRLSALLGISTLAFILISAALPLIITGGFHVDGFMDTMDALHSYQPRERKLEILKDSHIGAFSVIKLAEFGLIYVAALSQIVDYRALEVFCCGFFLSRCLSGLSVVSFRSAKTDGMLYHFASTAHERGVKGALYAQTLLCVLFMLWLSLLAGILAVAAAFAVFGYYRWRSYREFGGITGDTAGYFLTLCEGAMAVAAAVSVLI